MVADHDSPASDDPAEPFTGDPAANPPPPGPSGYPSIDNVLDLVNDPEASFAPGVTLQPQQTSAANST